TKRIVNFQILTILIMMINTSFSQVGEIKGDIQISDGGKKLKISLLISGIGARRLAFSLSKRAKIKGFTINDCLVNPRKIKSKKINCSVYEVSTGPIVSNDSISINYVIKARSNKLFK